MASTALSAQLTPAKGQAWFKLTSSRKVILSGTFLAIVAGRIG